jgi:hypothetical protein
MGMGKNSDIVGKRQGGVHEGIINQDKKTGNNIVNDRK